MINKGLTIPAFLAALFCLAGCHTSIPFVKAPLVDQGEVYLYLEPLSQKAERLRFTLGGISALGADGTLHPLHLALSEFDRTLEPGRQRLLASGPLPPGAYLGFSLQVRSAGLRGEEGESELLIPEEPILLECAFEVKRETARLISLSLKYAETVRSGFHFSPVFDFSIPGPPVSGLTGYLTNSAGHTVTVFDKREGKAFDVIATGPNPTGLALDPIRKRVYVAVSGANHILVADVNTSEVLGRIRLNPGDDPRELALSPDGNLLLAANHGSNTVSFLDPVSFFEIDRVPSGTRPAFLFLDREGRRAFLLSRQDDRLSVIDLASRTVTASVPTESAPLQGALNRRGDRLLVIHELSPYLLIFDPSSLSVVQRIFIGMGASSLEVDTRTDQIYIGRRNDPVVEVYDPFSLMPGDVIRSEGGVSSMAIDGEGNNLLLVIPERRLLQAVNLVSRKTVFRVDVGEAPFRLTLMGER